MQLMTGTKRKLATSAIAVLVSAFSGFVYPFIFPPAQQSAGPAWHSHINGIAVGTLIGLALSFGELYLFRTRIRRLRFHLFIIVQALYYVVTTNIFVISVMSSHYIMLHGHTFEEETKSSVFQAFFQSSDFLPINAYALAVIIILSSIRQVSRMLGQHALVNFFSGKYHKPVEEERVFMFLDLKASTSIAEKLGHKRYHAFLNDFFFDITPAIIESKGEIYQYVGDEVVVTWPKERGVRDANCINCYFRIAAAIARVADKYERKYDCLPAFKAGYHYGTVIAGLIGDIKRDIVFHGDTVNTASRIRSECTVVKRDLLLSGHLLGQLSISEYLTPENMGKIKLRGKEEEIELYSIKEAA
ncbi:MAG TPA: adenylate/guanylate cyclase domain-containing protein [Bacteroidota bacterium]|nr:adenylate/guanylate cyclase domain-containing protein [Bacteroidota bacterium]